MRKFLTILVCGVMLFSLCSCSKSVETTKFGDNEHGYITVAGEWEVCEMDTNTSDTVYYQTTDQNNFIGLSLSAVDAKTQAEFIYNIWEERYADRTNKMETVTIYDTEAYKISSINGDECEYYWFISIDDTCYCINYNGLVEDSENIISSIEQSFNNEFIEENETTTTTVEET